MVGLLLAKTRCVADCFWSSQAVGWGIIGQEKVSYGLSLVTTQGVLLALVSQDKVRYWPLLVKTTCVLDCYRSRRGVLCAVIGNNTRSVAGCY